MSPQPRVWMSAACLLTASASCDRAAESSYFAPDIVQVIGEAGRGPGQFTYPRAAAVGPNDELFVCDKTGRVQRFDSAGRLLLSWCLPYAADPTKPRDQQPVEERPAGFPVGMSFDAAGKLYVADTHYHRILVYGTDGTLLKRFGEYGQGPGQFVYPTCVAFDAKGSVYIAEYGGHDRIQKFTSDLQFVSEFGTPGRGKGQFSRPQSLLVDGTGRLWVADACNHRLCLYSAAGELIDTLGEFGEAPGKFNYPYGLAWDSYGNLLVAEMGNSRVQKLTADGRPLETWGRPGRGAGELKAPWAVATDSQGHLYVVDSGNNRVVRFLWP